jgi:hypothetical protein
MKKLNKIIATITILFLVVACNNSNNPKDSTKKTDSTISSVSTDSIITKEIKENPRESKDFEIFLTYFLKKLYFKDNLDRAMYNSSPEFLEFINEELPIGRFSAPGIYTILKDAPYFDMRNDFKTTNINLEKTEIIGNKLPKDGICEPSNLKDAIYYKVVKEAPIGYDMQNDRDGKYPKVLKGLKIIQVEIQVEKMIERTMYFTFYNGKWYFIYLDDSRSCGV